MTKTGTAFALLLTLTMPAYALEVHPDYRFAYGQCPTWDAKDMNGKYRAARAHLRVRETWDFKVSNYPTGWVVKPECQYTGCEAQDVGCKNDPMPAPMAGTYLLSGSTCREKEVVPKVCDGGANAKLFCHVLTDCPMGACVPGTESAESYPTAYIWLDADYNGGPWGNPNGCIWDPWAYGAPPAPTPTTTTVAP